MGAIPIRDDAHWRELRAKHVGGSDVAALFDLSPWITRFSLWHEKAGTVPSTIEENSRMTWGKRLEPAIAAGVAEDMRWKIAPSKVYHTHPAVAGLGCTLDFDIVDHEQGPGILEIKMVSEYATWMADWSETRAPAYYEVQVQHQLACTGRPWAVIAVFIGQTSTVKLYERRPDAKVIGRIESDVAAFWKSIAEKKAPDPFGTADEIDVIKALHPVRDPLKIVEIADAKLGQVAGQHRWAVEQHKFTKAEADRTKAILLHAATDAGLMRVPGHDVRIKTNKAGSVTLTVEAKDNGVVAPPPEPTTLAA